MVTPTFVLSVVVVTMAVLAFGTTQTYLRFSAGPDSGCGASGCARPDASHTEDKASGGAVADGTARGSALPSPGPATAGPGSRAGGHAVARIAYRTIRSQASGFAGLISITGRGSAPIRHWWLSVRYPGVQIVWMTGAGWHADADGTVTIEPVAQTPELRPGTTLPITFAATGQPAAPSDCRFDGAPCDVAG